MVSLSKLKDFNKIRIRYKLLLLFFLNLSTFFLFFTDEDYSYEQNLPDPTRAFYINDYSHILSENLEKKIHYIGSLLEDTDSKDIIVAIVPNTGYLSLDEYAKELFVKWITDQEHLLYDNFALLLITTDAFQVKLHVGGNLAEIIHESTQNQIVDKLIRDYRMNDNMEDALLEAYISIVSLVSSSNENNQATSKLNSSEINGDSQGLSRDTSWNSALDLLDDSSEKISGILSENLSGEFLEEFSKNSSKESFDGSFNKDPTYTSSIVSSAPTYADGPFNAPEIKEIVKDVDYCIYNIIFTGYLSFVSLIGIILLTEYKIFNYSRIYYINVIIAIFIFFYYLTFISYFLIILASIIIPLIATILYREITPEEIAIKEEKRRIRDEKERLFEEKVRNKFNNLKKRIGLFEKKHPILYKITYFFFSIFMYCVIFGTAIFIYCTGCFCITGACGSVPSGGSSSESSSGGGGSGSGGGASR